MEGKVWCAARDGFKDIQHDCAGRGSTPQEAVNNLKLEEKIRINRILME